MTCAGTLSHSRLAKTGEPGLAPISQAWGGGPHTARREPRTGDPRTPPAAHGFRGRRRGLTALVRPEASPPGRRTAVLSPRPSLVFPLCDAHAASSSCKDTSPSRLGRHRYDLGEPSLCPERPHLQIRSHRGQLWREHNSEPSLESPPPKEPSSLFHEQRAMMRTCSPVIATVPHLRTLHPHTAGSLLPAGAVAAGEESQAAWTPPTLRGLRARSHGS